jgi:hypothetical protein
MQVDTLGAENGAGAGDKDRGGGLEEEERLLGGGVVQLGDVVAISWKVKVSQGTEGRGRVEFTHA